MKGERKIFKRLLLDDICGEVPILDFIVVFGMVSSEVFFNVIAKTSQNLYR